MRKGEIDIDGRGLILEAYRIEGITLAECRSIFLDWAIGLNEPPTRGHLERLLAHYGARYPDHPMTAVLHEGIERPARPPRRRPPQR